MTVPVLLVALLALMAPASAPADSATRPLDDGWNRGPVAVAPVPGPVVRAFDPPSSPYGPGHRGVDLRIAPGDPVRAALPGVVTFAGQVARVGWVTVTHDDGMSTTYGGVTAAVRAGDVVALGAVIGHSERGRMHLDWGARVGQRYVDPLGLLRVWGVRLVPLDATA